MKKYSPVTACILLAVLLVFSAHAAENATIPSDKSKFPIILLMGQSNMEGAGYPVLSEYVAGIPDVFAFSNEMEWKMAKIPLGRGMSPGNVFARYFAKTHPGVKIGYVQTAVGGKSLKELSPGGPLYEDTLKRAKAAMKSGTLIAVLWHQGESDMGNANYPEQLKELVTRLRKDLDAEKVPFIVGELGHYNRGVEPFNKILAKVPGLIPDSAVVSAEGLTQRGDELHFSGWSVEIYGTRYLQKYLEMREPGLVVKYRPAFEKLDVEMMKQDGKIVTYVNPSMTEGEERPFGWDAKGYDFGPLPSIRDTKVFASAPASLRVESDKPVKDFVGTWLRDVKGRKLRVTCKMKNEGFDQCILRVAGTNSGFRAVYDKTVADASKAQDWQEFSAEFTVPQEASRDRLELFVSGKGKAWLDDVSIEKLDP